MEWAEEVTKPNRPPISEMEFHSIAADASFKDSYQETSGYLFYVLSQKLQKNVIAIEILREIKDKCGFKAWGGRFAKSMRGTPLQTCCRDTMR